MDSGLTSSAHICALVRHTHKRSRRDSTSVIGSLIFASAQRQAPRDCEYRYSMTALRANKTDNPPSERRMPFVRRSLFSFFLSHFNSFVAHFRSPFISISQCVVRYPVAIDIRISQDYGGFMLRRTMTRELQVADDKDDNSYYRMFNIRERLSNNLLRFTFIVMVHI